jgi:hypothetical protein
MAIPEPSSDHLLARIRQLDKSTTLIKAAGLLAELPTKRLLMKYIKHLDLQSLSYELLVHFRIVRNADSIARTLKRILHSDLENGVLVNDLAALQDKTEGGIRAVALRDLNQLNSALREVVNRRLINTDPAVVQQENLVQELERADYSVNRYISQADELLSSINNLKERFRRAQLSVSEADRRRKSLYLLREYVMTHNLTPDQIRLQRLERESVPAVSVEDRFAWSKRLQQALRLTDIKALNAENDGISKSDDDSSVNSKDKSKSKALMLISRKDPLAGGDTAENVDTSGPQNDTDTLLAKYSEIRNVCREFLDIVRTDAMIIISEHKQNKYRKTIPVYNEYTVQGRSKECGRGTVSDNNYLIHVENDKKKDKDKEGQTNAHLTPSITPNNGKYYTYLAHNIEYKVIEDYDGVFNGNDECAAKAIGGNERRCALEYFKAHIPGLNVPLMATVDYCGFRVIATAKQPTEVVQFTEDGEIRKISEELMHGVVKNGDNFINKGAKATSNTFGSAARSEKPTTTSSSALSPLQRLLKMFALKMNLSEHAVKGFNDIATSRTWASADLKVFKGFNDEFYLTSFYRSLPAEMTEFTAHLTRVPRDQSVFWRQLRPELLKHYEGHPVSPDAVSTIVSAVDDRDAQYDDSLLATKHLMNVLVPACINELIYRDYTVPLSEGLGLDLAAELHCRGVNIRHLGHMRAMLWRALPGFINFYFHENFVRTTKDHRLEVRIGDVLLIEGRTYTVQENVAENNRLTAKTIPLHKRYNGDSRNKIAARIGAAGSDKNNESLRTLFLAEMVARALKSIIRLQLRTYTAKEKIISLPFKVSLLAEYFNVVSGASSNANRVLMEAVYETVREKFGPYSILPSEQRNIQHDLTPCTLYIIKRLQTMLGVRLSLSCVSEFHERPQGFLFSSVDFVEVTPVVRHNIPLLAFSEAVLMSLQAQAAEKEVYLEQCLKDLPVALFKFSERAGARTAENISPILGSKATIAADKNLVDGSYSHYCELEQPGPVQSDPFIRAVGFKLEAKAWCECKFHPSVVPISWSQHFTVEAFVLCTGGHNNTRTALMCGRYAIVASRDNHWTFVLMQEMLEVNVRLAPIEYNKWCNIIATFDGTTVRCYFDSLMVASIESEPVMAYKMHQFEDEFREKKAKLAKEEADERAHLKVTTQKEAEIYFTSKGGSSAMKKAAQDIMESQQYGMQEGGGGEEGEEDDPARSGRPASPAKEHLPSQQQPQQHGSPKSKDAKDKDKDKDKNQLKQRRAEALRQAKNKYVTDLYVKNVREIAVRYRQLEAEIDDFRIKQVENGHLRSRKGIRVGAAQGSSSLKDGKNFFVGQVSCLSVYTTALNSDRIRAHFLSVIGDKTKQAQRLYAETSAKYEEAISFAPDDPMVLKGYAKSLCQYVNVELTAARLNSKQAQEAQGGNKAISSGKLKILEAINHFKIRHIPEGIAEILMALPRDVEFADVVSTAFDTIVALDRLFFAHSHPSMARKDLIYLPQIYGLDNINNSPEILNTCANMYKEVVRDVDIRYSYGEVDLGWIADLRSPELVICIVKYACENGNLRLLRVGDLFRTAGRDSISIIDADVEVRFVGRSAYSCFLAALIYCLLIVADVVPEHVGFSWLRFLELPASDNQLDAVPHPRAGPPHPQPGPLHSIGRRGPGPAQVDCGGAGGAVPVWAATHHR